MSASHRIMPFMTVGSITTVLFLLLGLLVIEAATDTPAESPVSSKRTDGVDPILWTALVVANETGHSTRDLLEQSQQCSVCTNQKPVPLPDKRLVVEGIPVETCAELDATAAYLPLDGDFCDTVRSIGSLCGCVNSKKNNHHHEENDDTGSEPCSLCSDGMSAPNATLSLPDFPANEYLFGAPPGAFMTCETMEAMLLYREDSSSPQCLAIRGDLAERCGCNTEDDDDNNGLPTPVSPTVSPAPSRPPVQQCQLCTYGGGIGLPDKAIELGDLPIENCADVEAFAGLLAEGTDDCEGIKAFGSYCGCSFPEESCTFCPNGEPVPFPDKKLQWFGDYLESLPDSLKSIGDSFTCSMMDSALKVPGDLYGVESSYACLSAQLKSAVCGCSRGWRTNLLNWISRGSGISSMLGSLIIIVHILTREKRRRASTYHQIVLGISVFDFIGSFAYALYGVMTPVDSGYHGSIGTDRTCKMNGLLIQIGLTAMQYNLVLTLYFVMVICYNWREQRFKSLVKYVHLVTVSVGLGLAAASWSFIGPEFGTCYILRPPFAESFVPLTLIYTVPVSIVTVIVVLGNIAICIHVSRQQLGTTRFSTNQHMQLSRSVFFQSFWFMLSFGVTLPTILVGYYWPSNVAGNFVTRNIVTSFLRPLQGTLNALAYFHRNSNFDDVIAKNLKRLSKRFSSVVDDLSNRGNSGRTPFRGQLLQDDSPSIFHDDRGCSVTADRTEKERNHSYSTEFTDQMTLDQLNSMTPAPVIDALERLDADGAGEDGIDKSTMCTETTGPSEQEQQQHGRQRQQRRLQRVQRNRQRQPRSSFAPWRTRSSHRLGDWWASDRSIEEGEPEGPFHDESVDGAADFWMYNYSTERINWDELEESQNVSVETVSVGLGGSSFDPSHRSGRGSPPMRGNRFLQLRLPESTGHTGDGS